MDEAIATLRAHADVGDGYASERLIELLTKQGREDDLRTRVEVGDWNAGGRLEEAEHLRRFGLGDE